MTSPIIPGAEPFSALGATDGVLVLHGFTGNPASLRGVAERCAADGYSVELPLLPGHGTALEDLIPMRWADWSTAAEAAYAELAGRCARVAVVALSMGGTLSCWLATRHPEIVALVLVNPLVEPPAESFRDVLRALLQDGVEVVPGIGSDIADPDSHESSYPGTPAAAALSLFEGVDALRPGLAEIRCPILLFTSAQDHVVPTSSSDLLAASASGPVERVLLERSYHVATLDYDKAEIEARASEWLAKRFAAAE